MAFAERLQLMETCAITRDVDFGPHHCKRTLCQLYVVGTEFLAHDLEARYGIIGGPFRDIDQVKQKGGAFDVAEKLESQTFPLMGSFDQTGDIRYNKRAIIAPSNYTEVRGQCRERIVGDFRACRRNGSDQTDASTGFGCSTGYIRAVNEYES